MALCASAPEFRIVERDMIESFVKRGFQIDMIQKWICERFANGIKNVVNEYDYILIDCPPGISLFAEAALIAADAILVPTIPDYVSRLGLITFRKRALRLINERRGGPSQLMVLATKYEDSFSLHRSEAQLLKDNLGEAMFDVRIPQHVDIAKAAEWSETPRTFEQKYGAMANIVKKLGEEFQSKVELAPSSMSLNKTLDRLFDEIRREAKRNPDFADRLDAVLRVHDSAAATLPMRRRRRCEDIAA